MIRDIILIAPVQSNQGCNAIIRMSLFSSSKLSEHLDLQLASVQGMPAPD